MSTPGLSVCIPSYNQCRYIGPALDSILAQSYTDFELLVVDDCSTDGTRELVAGRADRDRRIKVVAHPRNIGMVPNWNSCLAAARGEYVKFLFGDDILVSPDALGIMVRALDADLSISLVTSARKLIDADGRGVGEAAPFPRNMTLPGLSVITRCLVAQRNLVGEPSAVMFRRRQTERGFDLAYRQYVDLEMWFHLLEQGNLRYFREPLVAFRRHGEQQTEVNVRNLVHIDELLTLYREFLDRPYVTVGELGKRFLVLSQYYRIWKLFRIGSISRLEAETRIESGYGLRRFMLHLPFYKIMNPVWKLMILMSRLDSR
jgi:glycosyltransferase involved in cell wall biosynthesis